MTTIQTETAAKFLGCKAVKSTNVWGDRIYLKLWDKSDRFRGDSSVKFWIDGRGKVTFERGKGTMSEDFSTSVEMVNAFITENALELIKR